MVSRPQEALMPTPGFERDGSIYVLNRQQYPRPILNAAGLDAPINQSRTAGFIAEPIMSFYDPLANRMHNVKRVLSKQGKIPESDILSISDELVYYPSPGGINERVHGQLVNIKPQSAQSPIEAEHTGFSESGFVQAVNAQQTLRSYQVGGMFDSRLELNIYHLLLSQKKSVGPWVGAEMKLASQDGPLPSVEMSATAALTPARTRPFEPVERPSGYLELRRGSFSDRDAAGNTLKSVELEYALPKRWSRNTLSAMLIYRRNGEVFVGLETQQLPASQVHEGSASILTNTAWRLQKGVQNLDEAEAYLKNKIHGQYRIRTLQMMPLGGEYYTSAGVSPEIVFPYLVEVDAKTAQSSKLKWVSLKDLLAHRREIRDGHLLTGTYRAAHLLGIIE